MLIACGLFGYSLNTIGSIFNSINVKEEEIKNSISIISNFMRKKKINDEL